jgi:hypothetical protein
MWLRNRNRVGQKQKLETILYLVELVYVVVVMENVHKMPRSALLFNKLNAFCLDYYYTRFSKFNGKLFKIWSFQKTPTLSKVNNSY